MTGPSYYSHGYDAWLTGVHRRVKANGGKYFGRANGTHATFDVRKRNAKRRVENKRAKKARKANR